MAGADELEDAGGAVACFGFCGEGKVWPIEACDMDGGRVELELGEDVGTSSVVCGGGNGEPWRIGEARL